MKSLRLVNRRIALFQPWRSRALGFVCGSVIMLGSGAVSWAANPAAPGEKNSTASQGVTERAADVKANSILRHAVFFAFKEESSAEEIQGVVDAFVALPSKI